MTEIRLPFPPSVNQMYGAKRGRGRGRYILPDYANWRTEVYDALSKQKPRPVLGPCQIWIDLDDRRQGDADNRTKGILDALVEYGTIGGDSKKHVRRVSIGWAKCDGCRVAIEELNEPR